MGWGGVWTKGASLDWATFHPLPLTPRKTLVIPHSKVTSQGGPPTPALLGRTDCHLSKDSHTVQFIRVFLNLGQCSTPRRRALENAGGALPHLHVEPQKQRAEKWMPGVGEEEMRCWSKGTKFQLYKMSKL